MSVQEPTKKNVVDFYQYWSNEAIVADLDERRNNFSVLLINVKYDINIGSAIRSALAFMAKEVILYGRKQFDRRSSVGSHRYQHFKTFREVEELKEFMDGNYRLVAFENTPEAINLYDFEWETDKHTILVFGQECDGIPENILELCHDITYIPMQGPTRSLNLASAATLGMSEYIRNTKYKG